MKIRNLNVHLSRTKEDYFATYSVPATDYPALGYRLSSYPKVKVL